MQKLLKKIILLLPIPALVFITTWIVDPANIKNNESYETGVASILISGKNVVNVTNFKERTLQRNLVLGLHNIPEIIVLGSSRSLQINSAMFPNKSFFNHSVSGASIEDYLGIFNLYRKMNSKPKLVIIGLDPWVLNRNNGQDRWREIYDEYIEMKYSLGFTTTSKEYYLNKIQNYKKYKEFLSPAYFIQSCSDLTKNERTGGKYRATDKLQDEDPIKIADGSYVYGTKMREKKVTDINSDAKIFAMAKPMYSLGEYNELDQPTMQLFESFIDYLLRNDIQVMLLLPPYHPTVYEFVKADTAYKMVIESEKWYRYLAEKNNLNIVGSYNPKALDLEESDFYDGMHPKNKALHRIFDNRRKKKN